MCTSIRFKNCMGRNYDYEQSYEETVTTLPKGYNNHKYPMIGICTGLVRDYPLFYDAMNSEGLCASALAFTGNAHYNRPAEGKRNIPPYDIIGEVVGNCKDVDEAKELLSEVNIVDEPYSPSFPNTDLHWFICDKMKSIVAEATDKGLMVYDNQYDVLTNNPPFPQQATECKSMDSFIGKFYYPGGKYSSRGTETLGVKGDTTSMSRFYRVHYYLERMKKPKNPICYNDCSTMHLLSTVEQTWGATPVGESFEYTIYSAVYDMLNLELCVKPYTSTSVKRYSLTNRERRYKI